jgi:hypothetical protein
MIIEDSSINTSDWKYQLDLWKDDGSSRVLFIRGTGGGSNSIYVEGQPIEIMAIGNSTDNAAKPMALIQELKSLLIAYPKNSAINVPIYHFDVMGGIMTTQTKDGRPMCILNAIAETDRNEVN